MTRATRMQYKAIANSKTSNKTISIQIPRYIHSRIIANVILVYRDHHC